uniref:Uncharacterized protein n=1 Tax=Meloidogyne enterolobii TaxID=390850 RepID=A0A6V7VY81_MELEN|nr:unnamed protein product [Meloidogyne enterolobii]
MSTNRIEQQNRLTIYLNSKTTQDSEEENLQQPTNGQELKLTHFGRAKLFFRKYFLQGQLYSNEVCSDDDEEEVLEDIFNRYRKYIGFLIPCLFMQIMWWTLAFRYNFFRLFPTHYELPLTMVVGATVAGMTSEGGGAVAFPVMTLLLHIETEVARDFSLMVQSCGMTSATFTILWMRIKLEWHAIILCTIGSTAGIIFGLEWVDYLLTGSEKKMLFVSIWFSFAISLYVLNTQKKRRTHSGIVKFNWWKALILFVAGFIGGLCSAFAGSGVDICAFSVLTLLFRLSEKVATPTSANTCVGFFWRHLIMSEVSTLAWNYFTCSVPVVVLFAPLGSLLASHFHRLVLASFVYVLEGLALLGFLATGPEWRLIGIGSVIIFCSFFFFLAVSRIGYWLDETERKTTATTKLNGKNCGQIKSKESKTIRKLPFNSIFSI